MASSSTDPHAEQSKPFRTILTSYITDIISSGPPDIMPLEYTLTNDILICLTNDIEQPVDRIYLMGHIPDHCPILYIGGTPLQITYLVGQLVGNLPATNESIAQMAYVKGEEHEACVVCVGEYKADEMAREMPCKHVFCDTCITKWLRVRSTCPLCRYNMPVESDERRDFWLNVYFEKDENDNYQLSSIDIDPMEGIILSYN